jgi:ParB family chromosome partitioning protein
MVRPNDSDEARVFEGRYRLKEAATIRRDRIVPDPNQPRTEFDEIELEHLAGSLRDRGQLQPIRVRWDADADRYIIVLGERRWRAAGLIGLESMACVVVDSVATPEDRLEDQLVENALRSDLRPIELARSYQALMTARGLTQRALAERLHVSAASVAKAVALLNLPEPIQHEVDAGTIGPDVAYQLSKVEDAEEQAELASQALAGLIRRDDLQERTRTAPPRQTKQKKYVWSHDVSGRVRVTVSGLAENVDPSEMIEAVKAALAAFRKGKTSAA